MAGLKAWPGIEVEYDGQWVRRAAAGYTKRANSVQCLDPADGANAAARIAAARQWFEVRGIAPVFRVTPLTAAAANHALSAAGWKPFDYSRTMAVRLDRNAVTADSRGAAMRPDDPRFLAAQRALQAYDDATVGKLGAVIAAIAVRAAGIVVHTPDGMPAASVLMGVADGIAFAGNVVTAAGERRRGYGMTLMRAGLAWAAHAGAHTAALNVAADNAPALAFYGRLGYSVVYDYHYCKAPRS